MNHSPSQVCHMTKMDRSGAITIFITVSLKVNQYRASLWTHILFNRFACVNANCIKFGTGVYFYWNFTISSSFL